MINERHPLAQFLNAFADNKTVECRVRPGNGYEPDWRVATLQDIANGASDVEFRVVNPKAPSNSIFDGLFDCVVEGLREYYPVSLRNADVVALLRRAVRNDWSGTGNNQSDYEALRDRVEREVNNFGAVKSELPQYTVAITVEVHNERVLYLAAHSKLVDSGVDGADADSFLRTDGQIDVASCLVQMMDPGESPVGIQIIDSSATIEV